MLREITEQITIRKSLWFCDVCGEDLGDRRPKICNVCGRHAYNNCWEYDKFGFESICRCCIEKSALYQDRINQAREAYEKVEEEAMREWKEESLKTVKEQ